MALAGASQLLAGAALLPVALSMPMPGQPSVLTWVTMLMFSLSCSALAYILYYRLIKDIGPTRTFTVTFLVPVFAMAWGALLLGEPVHAHMVVGGIIIVASTLLVLGLNPLAWFRGRPASAGGGRDG